jgi:hypothetical protein
MQEQLLRNIKSITQNGSPVIYSDMSIDTSYHMYDSTKTARWRVLIDGKYMSQKDKLIIGYECLTCKSFNEISSLRFLRKLNSKNLAYCYTCRNQNEEKRLTHSQFMTGKNIRSHPQKEIKKIMNNVELHEHAMSQFAQSGLTFQQKYAQCHLMDEDMLHVFPHLISLRNGKVAKCTLENCTYWSVFPCSNQMKYTSVFYDASKDEIIKLDQPIMRCEECHGEWRAKNIHKMKNDIRILCKDCKLCRKIFKIRGFDTSNGDRITYQSRQEKSFIDWCEENRIVIINGPTVPYVLNTTNHVYKVDFALPSLGILVEVKDDHIWHKQQLANGKWNAKLEGVQTYIQNQSCYNKFVMLTPQNKRNVYQEILSKLNKI